MDTDTIPQDLHTLVMSKTSTDMHQKNLKLKSQSLIFHMDQPLGGLHMDIPHITSEVLILAHHPMPSHIEEEFLE